MDFFSVTRSIDGDTEPICHFIEFSLRSAYVSRAPKDSHPHMAACHMCLVMCGVQMRPTCMHVQVSIPGTLPLRIHR